MLGGVLRSYESLLLIGPASCACDCLLLPPHKPAAGILISSPLSPSRPTTSLPCCSHQPGFQQLKLVRGPKGVTCFIEYTDIPSAMAVHDAQQGAILASSDRGGIRIQYSKNPFGRKRDAAGAFVEGAPGGGPMQPSAQPGGGGPPRTAADMQQQAMADAAAAAYAAVGQQAAAGS